jgi:hypothetical protein
MRKGRAVGFLVALTAGSCMALPTGALAHTKIVTLEAEKRYRGYTITIRAMKQDYERLGISVILRNGIQTHHYHFEAPRRHLTFGPNLRSGTLKLASLSGAAAQVVGEGDGTIRFAATGPARVKNCSGPRSTKTRAQVRTSGRLRFRLTDEHEFVRRKWRGKATKLAFGGCIRPLTCKWGVRLSAFRTDGNENFSVLAWRFRSGGPVRVEGAYFVIDPIGPSVFTGHTRVAHVGRHRFSASGLTDGTLDLDGVPGFGGSYDVRGDGQTHQWSPPCEGRVREGTAEGTVSTAFTFTPDRTESAWTGAMIARGEV